MNYLNNNSSQYNFNYSSNPCLTNKNNCIQNDTLSFNCDQSKVQNLICCYEGEINSFNWEFVGIFIFIIFKIGNKILFNDLIWFNNLSLIDENVVFRIFIMFSKFSKE